MDIPFTKVNLPFGWLGNMAAYPVTHENIEYKTTEALFQALRFKNHPEIMQEIREQKSPMTAKMVAKKYADVVQADGFKTMSPEDVTNMRLCLDLKLAQHPELSDMLLATGNDTIIEDCTSRPRGSGIFWGAALQNGQWKGQNILGKMWMEIRAELQLKNSTTFTEQAEKNEEPVQLDLFSEEPQQVKKLKFPPGK